MKTKLLTIITLLLSSVGCLEVSAQNALVVETKDGMTYSYVLAEKPRLSFNNTEMMISTADADATFERTDIKNFRFEDVETGISELTANSQRISYLNGIITVESDEPANLYDTAGRLLMSSKATEGKCITIDMNAYPKGTYIINCGKQSMKVKR